MRTGAALLGMAVLLAGVAGLITRWPRSQDSDTLGRLRIYPAWFVQTGLTFQFAAASGWSARDSAAARALARSGQRVIGIEPAGLLDLAARHPHDCLYLPGVLEAYSQDSQRELRGGRYFEPALIGRGAGGTLVYLALLQAPALAFGAGVIWEPAAELDFAGTFCDLQPRERAGNRYWPRFDPISSAVPLRTLHGPHSASLGALYATALTELRAQAPANPLADLPLVELPVPVGGELPLAVLYSGDGGWRDLDRSLAYILQAHGMPVVGVDVLRYYWTRKLPGPAAADLARIIPYYQQRWGRSRVVLIGFSFGANVLPFLVNRLPASVRSAVSLVSLLSPERSTAFAVDPRAWLGMGASVGTAIGPELERLPPRLVQCIYGEEEAAASLCTQPAAAGTQVVRKPGNHHFDGDYEQLAAQILAAAGAARALSGARGADAARGGP